MMFFGNPPAPARAGVRDEIDRVAGARVFGQAGVVEIDAGASTGSMHDIFEHGAEAARGGVDFRLLLRR